MPLLEIKDPKTARDLLCVAQHRMLGFTKIQELIDAIDVIRPLGPDGKHGDRHTENCGCQDKGGRLWCIRCHQEIRLGSNWRGNLQGYFHIESKRMPCYPDGGEPRLVATPPDNNEP